MLVKKILFKYLTLDIVVEYMTVQPYLQLICGKNKLDEFKKID